MRKFFFILFIIFPSLNAFAFNTSFLNDAPVSFFTSQDTDMMNQAMIKALNNAKDNSKASWRNPSTGAGGYFIPSHTIISKGRKCRDLAIFTEARNRTGQSKYQFCKINNAWKIVH